MKIYIARVLGTFNAPKNQSTLVKKNQFKYLQKESNPFIPKQNVFHHKRVCYMNYGSSGTNYNLIQSKYVLL